MGLLIWIIFGALVGWLASLVLGTDAGQGALGNIILGIVGAVVGGLIMQFFGFAGVTGFNLYSVLVAILGALVTVGLARLIK